MSLDLNKLENKLDEALSNETSESLTTFLTDKRMTNNKQKTAVEWGVEKLATLTFDYMAGFINKSEYDELSKGIIREAKEMEKQKLEDAWVEGFKNYWNPSKTFEEYYNETYGGEQ